MVPLRPGLCDGYEIGADFDDVPRPAALGQTLLGVGPVGMDYMKLFLFCSDRVFS